MGGQAVAGRGRQAQFPVTAGQEAGGGGGLAQEIKAGDIVRVRRDADERIVEVVDASLVKRVGASVAARAYIDRTPEKPPPIPEMIGRVAVRDRGAGRPEKKDRRALERLRGFER